MVLNIKNRPQKRLDIAVPLILGAALFMALMAVMVKLGASLNLTTPSMVFWRNFVSLGMLWPWIQWGPPQKPIVQKLRTNHWHLHWIRGTSSFFSVSLYFLSIQFLDLASATVLFNTIPIFVPLVAYIWKKLPIHHCLWWAIGIAFGGILLVLQPGTNIVHWASLVALLSGILGAISVVSLRLGHYSENAGTMLFYLFGFCLFWAVLFTIFSFDQSWSHFSWTQLKIFIPLGIFGFSYQLLLTFSTKFAPIRLLSPFLYVAVIFTIVFDRVIWGISLSLFQLFGFLLIVLGAVLMFFLYPKDDLKIK